MSLHAHPTPPRIALGPVLVAALAFVLACNGPIGPFAGGALSGKPGPAEVSDWSFAKDFETLDLETKGRDPRSVTVWFATVGSGLYISSSMIHGSNHPSERGWVRAVDIDPNVRIRIDGIVYERRARRVEDEAEFDAARTALETKYDLDPAKRDPERTIWIYRLDARSH